MRKCIGLIVLLAVCLSANAWEYETQDKRTSHAAQMRIGATFTKEWHNGLRLGLEEDLRFDMYNSLYGPAFRRSYTTAKLTYVLLEYVRFDAGYTLKVIGPDSTWTDSKRQDVNELLRHHVFASVTGAYMADFFKLYLRERVMCEMRTDSINPLEKNKYKWTLRSKLGANFYVPGKPVKPYVWVELVNTLNAPEYQQKNGHQFITDVRTQAGVKWRVSRNSSLDFYYRFRYGYDRDINITKKKGYIELTEETLFQHAIGITYNFDW